MNKVYVLLVLIPFVVKTLGAQEFKKDSIINALETLDTQVVSKNERAALMKKLKEDLNSLDASEINAIKDNQGRSLLRVAVHYAPAHIIELLISKGQDVNAVEAGVTPIISAIAYGNIDAFKTLLRYNADLSFRSDSSSVLAQLLTQNAPELRDVKLKMLLLLAENKFISKIIAKDLQVNAARSWIYDLSTHIGGALYYLAQASRSEQGVLYRFFENIINASSEKIKKDPSIIETLRLKLAAIKDTTVYPYAKKIVEMYLKAGADETQFTPEVRTQLGLTKPKSSVGSPKMDPAVVTRPQSTDGTTVTETPAPTQSPAQQKSNYARMLDKLRAFGDSLIKKIFRR